MEIPLWLAVFTFILAVVGLVGIVVHVFYALS